MSTSQSNIPELLHARSQTTDLNVRIQNGMNGDRNNKTKKNRPKDTRLRQQKLSAWRPVLTASSVIPTVFLVGICFIPFGVVLYVASESVKEQVTEYTNCVNASVGFCLMTITLSEPFEGNVYFYYGLENYFQNHRRYVKSRSDQQLLGDLHNLGDCSPYDKMNTSEGVKDIAPCGAIANSMFNDTFSLQLQTASSLIEVPWTYKGVVWAVDKNHKFKNPPGPNLKEAFAGTTKPPNWQKYVWELDDMNPDNNGFLNTDFIVWMRTAALPNFRKLYRILNRTNTVFASGLPKGEYRLRIINNYPVSAFGGRKYFIISTTSWAGGKNSFLGIMYMIVGCICLVFGVLFLVIHLKFGSQ